MPIATQTCADRYATLSRHGRRHDQLETPTPSLLPWELVIQLQARLDIHTHQLLDQQLGRVRHRHLDHAATALARLTPVVVAHHAARLAHVDLVRVGA